MTVHQETAIFRYTKQMNATVTATQELEGGVLMVTYSVPQAPGQESLTATGLPEWAEVIYSPRGTELITKSSWDERRRFRHTYQAAVTGSLE